MEIIAKFELGFSGLNADSHELDLYDASRALYGFHRVLSLTSHLFLNNEVITQANALKSARILSPAATAGSWKMAAIVFLGGGLWAAAQAPQNSELGYLLTSGLDYVVSSVAGFHIDFNKTFGQQYEEIKSKRASVPMPDQSRLDAVAEKCEGAIKDIHRPIVFSQTASKAKLGYERRGFSGEFDFTLNEDSFEFINYTEKSGEPSELYGRVSSYNSNTYKGRIFVPDEGRPIPFELAPQIRTSENVNNVVNSLVENALVTNRGFIRFKAFINTSKTGRVKSFHVVEIGSFI